MAATPSRFVSIKEFAARSSLSRGTIYNLIERGEISPPVRLTENRVAFTSDAVDAWLSSRQEAA